MMQCIGVLCLQTLQPPESRWEGVRNEYNCSAAGSEHSCVRRGLRTASSVKWSCSMEVFLGRRIEAQQAGVFTRKKSELRLGNSWCGHGRGFSTC